MHLLRLCVLAFPWCTLLGVDTPAADRLPVSAGIVADAGGAHWRAFAIHDIDRNHDIVLELDGRQLVVARALVAQDDGEAAAALPGLVSRATAAGLDPARLRLERGLLTGIHLQGDEALVLSDGVLRREALPAPDLAAEQQALHAAATVLTEALGATRLTPLGQGAVRRLLTTLGEASVSGEDFTPGFVRRLLNSGWLGDDLGGLPAWATLRTVLAQAMALQPLHRWRADQATLTEYVDAFAQRVFVLTTPAGSARLQNHAPSSYDAPAPRMVVQRFAAGVDPLSSTMPSSAEVWWGRQRLAQWDAQAGFRADAAAWRTALADSGPGVGSDTVVDWRPPHLVVSDAQGAVLALCTAHGVLRPAQSGSGEERERFLADAARLSPDAQHLDLIGQYLFSYVNDSPDPRRPGLIGVKGLTGDIHQTVEQTVATVCAGVMRGDCDDLSEVYHDLLTRQGRLPQVVSLPRHAACAWSLHEGDRWTTQVLHTGQPLAFHGETLEESLALAFGHFDQHNSDHGTMVRILLRFAGENTRSHWHLGSRIMRDADYARTMIAVQGDWYFHTHANGIATMHRLIAAGDDTSANWSELAGLYHRTGQWQAAIAAQRACLEHLSDPIPALDARLTLISLLTRAGQHAEAEHQALGVLEALPGIFTDQQSGLRQQAVRRLYALLPDEQHRTLTRRLLQDELLPALELRRQELTRWAGSHFDRRTWLEQAQDDRYGAALLIGAAQAGLERGAAPLEADPDLQRLLAFADHWLTGLAFLDTGERDGVMAAYATAGQQAGALLGAETLDALLERTVPPPAWTPLHQRRSSGLPQLIHDLPWIRISVPYWSQRLGALLGKRELDEIATLQVIARLRAAAQACDRLEIQTTGLERTLLWAHLIEALVRRDRDALRVALQACAERHDRSTDELVTSAIVTMAGHLPPAWFHQVLATWDEHAASKSGYFTIAWGCALAGSVAQALEAGALAARRFADDPAFPAEFTYLQQVLAGGEEP